MTRYLLLFSMCLCLMSDRAMGDLRVDINDRNANTEATTQPGFVGVTQLGASGIATDIGSINIAFSNVAPSGAIDDRDRGASSVSSSLPLARLLRDLLYTQATLPDRGTLDVTVSNLNAGNYLFTGYFHDPSVNHVSGDILLSTDAGATFPTDVEDVLFSTGANPSPFGHVSIPFTATGSDVVFRIIGDGGTTGFTSETALLDGFVIEPFTELGDFDRSGGVTTADFLILSGNLGTHLEGNFVGHAGGDMDVDGDVDLDDFGMFKALFPSIVAAATAVPEPGTGVIAGAIALALFAARRGIRRG